MAKGRRGSPRSRPLQRELIEKRAALLRRNVRRLAKLEGLTLREVADRAGISERSLYNILRRPRAREEPSYPSFETLVLLAWALKTTEAQLLGGEEGRPSRAGERERADAWTGYVAVDEAAALLGLGAEEFPEFLHPFVERGGVRVVTHPTLGQLFHRRDLQRVAGILGGRSDGGAEPRRPCVDS